MIKELKLSNFRLFDDEVAVRFRPITVLIGRNNAGKSSIMKFLLMLQQSIRPPAFDFLTPEGERVQLGEFGSLKNSSSKKDSLQFGLKIESYQVPEQIEQFLTAIRQEGKGKQPQMLQESTDEQSYTQMDKRENLKAMFDYEASVSYKTRGIGKQTIRARSNWGLKIQKEKAVRRFRSNLMEFGNLITSARRENNFRTYFDSNFPLMQIKQYNDDEIKEHLDSIAAISKEVYENLYISMQEIEIASLKHISAARESFSRVIEVKTPPKHSVGQDGRYAIHHLQKIMGNKDKNTDMLLKHLKSIGNVEDIYFVKSPMGDRESAPVVTTATARNSRTKAKTNLAEFGFGVSQVFPILVQGVIQDSDTQLMVEQPEAQLHPTAQLELGTFFADIWKERQVMSIIETHSDNILLRLRRLIAKGELDKDDVSVAFFTTKRGSKPTIKNLNIDEDGSMEEGLPMEFFHANIVEALEMGAGK